MKSNSENVRKSLRQGQITEGDQISRPIGKLLSEREVEALYGFRVRTLQRWRTTGAGPRFCKANRAVLYSIDDIEAFLSERMHHSTDEYSVQAATAGVDRQERDVGAQSPAQANDC